ncbi:MAG: phosphatidylinositol-binding protein scs2 [Candelina submexicana]|nr:MAG: phosphatidylinositol-binding protein scs2 [Candelina submexicana]
MKSLKSCACATLTVIRWLSRQVSLVQNILQVAKVHGLQVKTTAPKQYCVRPNSGRIEPGKDVEVQVLLQAMKEDPPLDTRCRDKFLVQSVAVSADKESSNVSSIWQHMETTARSSIQERKIRVVFLPSNGSSAPPIGSSSSPLGSSMNSAPNAVNGTHQDHETPQRDSTTYRSFTPEAVTPQTRSVVGAPAGASSLQDTRPSDNVYAGDTREPTINPATSEQKSTVSSFASNVANAVPTSGDDLRAQLADAKNTIMNLKQQAEEQGLRQRKADAVNQDSRERISTGTTGMGIQQQPADGVPVQIVAALCLLSFLLAYFFF